MDVIEEKLGLTRTKLVGFSLLVGSDYNNKIRKLSKNDALKFISSVPDDQIIQRLVSKCIISIAHMLSRSPSL